MKPEPYKLPTQSSILIEYPDEHKTTFRMQRYELAEPPRYFCQAFRMENGKRKTLDAAWIDSPMSWQIETACALGLDLQELWYWAEQNDPGRITAGWKMTENSVCSCGMQRGSLPAGHSYTMKCGPNHVSPGSHPLVNNGVTGGMVFDEPPEHPSGVCVHCRGTKTLVVDLCLGNPVVPIPCHYCTKAPGIIDGRKALVPVLLPLGDWAYIMGALIMFRGTCPHLSKEGTQPAVDRMIARLHDAGLTPGMVADMLRDDAVALAANRGSLPEKGAAGKSVDDA